MVVVVASGCADMASMDGMWVERYGNRIRQPDVDRLQRHTDDVIRVTSRASDDVIPDVCRQPMGRRRQQLLVTRSAANHLRPFFITVRL